MKKQFGQPALPSIDDQYRLADWAELTTIRRKRMSRSSLQSAIQQNNGKYRGSAADDVWFELERRSRLHADFWPFIIDEAILQRKPLRKCHTVYYFFCALSLGMDVTKAARTLFEDCVAELVKGISQNRTMRLGHPPASGMPKSFRKAIRHYAEQSGEQLIKEPPSTDNDLGVDVVTWLQFCDKRSGQQHFVGQCSTGADWEDKLADVDTRVWNDYLSWAALPVRFFATPYVIPENKWRRACQKGGLILDRPRLLELANKSGTALRTYAQVQQFCSKIYA